MIISKVKYDDTEAHNLLIEKIKANIDSKPVTIVCIGTDKCIGDSIGPIVGTLLKEKGYTNVYGTLSEPIHALNIKDKIPSILENHKDNIILAIDASLGHKSNIGKIYFKNDPISPGAGVGKKLPQIGDFAINGVVDDCDIDTLFNDRTIRLSMVYDMSKAIANILINSIL